MCRLYAFSKLCVMRPIYLLLCIIVVKFLAVVPSEAQTMDEIISDAAESTREFAFFQGEGQTPMIKLELDMIFTPEQWEEMQRAKSGSRQRRKAIRANVYRWPGGVIPYEIRPVFSERDRGEIMKALAEWSNFTCIKFRPATSSDKNKVYFDNGSGCYSNVGRINDPAQQIGLAAGCRSQSIIAHEVGHAVGFQHEQTRPDRNSYVEIIRENIPPHLYYNFDIHDANFVNNFDVPYDYTSIMHYGSKAFSINGGVTIKTKNPEYQNVIGNSKRLSFSDIKLANIMYQCSQNARCSSNIQCPEPGFVDKNCKCMCPGSPLKECSGTSLVTRIETTTTRRITTTTGVCRDRYTSCRAWAQREECESSFMDTYCKESCNRCSGSLVSSCTDMAQHCQYWKDRGYCYHHYVDYMRMNCAKTCNLCVAPVRRDQDIDTDGHSTTTTATHPNNSGHWTSYSSLQSLFFVLIMCNLIG